MTAREFMTTRRKLDGLLAHFAELTKQAGGSRESGLHLDPQRWRKHSGVLVSLIY